MVSYVERRDWEGPKPGPGAGPAVTGHAAQTKRTWARRVERPGDLPAAFVDAVRELLGGRPLPYAVLCPAFPVHASPTDEGLILQVDDRLWIVQRRDGSASTTGYRVRDIHAVEVGDVLLDGWLTLHGAGPNAEPQVTTLRYNTTTAPLLEPFVRAARLAAGADPREAASEPAALRAMRRRSLKFYNLARALLRDADPLVDAVFQPTIRRAVAGLPLPILRREIAPAHLLMATGTELLLATDITGRGGRRDRYGHLLTYLPRAHVTGVRMARRDGLQVVQIGLPFGEGLEVAFERGVDLDALLAPPAGLG